MSYENRQTSLTLPNGAGPGTPRIILDGDNATITIVGSAETDRIIISVGPDGVPRINIQDALSAGDVFVGIASEAGNGPGFVGPEYTETVWGELVRPKVLVQEVEIHLGQIEVGTGSFVGAHLQLQQDEVHLSYRRHDGVNLGSLTILDSRILFDNADITVDTANVIDNHTRRIPPTGVRTANSGNITSAVEVIVDTITVPLISGKIYRVTWAGAVFSSVKDGVARARIREDNAAGTQIGFAQIETAEQTASGANNKRMETEYTAVSTGNKTFVATVQRLSGTGNVVAQAGATNPTYLYCDYVREV